MTLDKVYGTRPDLLPRCLVKLVLAAGPNGKKRVWAGPEGVDLLDLDEHVQYEQDSIRRYPRDTSGAVEWGVVDSDLVLGSFESDAVQLDTLVRRFAPRARSVVFFWSSLAVPSVRIEVDLLASCQREILQSNGEFWVYSADDQVLCEFSFFGTVTVARVPADSAIS